MKIRNFGAMYDLHTFMWDDGDQLGGITTYNSDIFDEIVRCRVFVDAGVCCPSVD